MYFAGLHVEEDLMGKTESWREVLEYQGFDVECETVEHNNLCYFKGLAYYPKCIDSLIQRVSRSLKLAELY